MTQQGQLALFPGEKAASARTAEIVNVASVPHRSPFRYPGGKTWLVPRIRQWLGTRAARPCLLIEPFAGGAIVGLTVAFEKLADHVILVELDPQVAAVWRTIISDGHGDALARRIGDFVCTKENVEVLFGQEPGDLGETAFHTIVKNRVSRGGILASGAGMIKSGESGKGIASRWYVATLQRRILELSLIRERLTFVEGDAFQVIESFADRTDAVFFVDPPYTAGGKLAGSRLYTHSELDHERLFAFLARVAGDFLMTYDNAAAIHDLAARYGLDTQPIAMKSTHHAEMTELLIGRDLAWARTF